MLTRTDWDRIAVQGCQTPGCDHSEHDGTIYWHSRCHSAAPFFLLLTAVGAVIAHCAMPRCALPVAELPDDRMELPEGACFPVGGFFRAACHPESAVWLRYRYGTGKVEIVCYECKESCGAIGV